MRLKLLMRGLPLLAAATLSAGAVTACAHNNYDNSGYSNRRWDDREEAAYRRWEAERNLAHVEYKTRVADEQRAYWAWRRDHMDRDRNQ